MRCPFRYSCPFRYKRRNKFSFGVSGDFLDFVEEQENKEELEYNTKYPTCWDKFIKWLKS